MLNSEVCPIITKTRALSKLIGRISLYLHQDKNLQKSCKNVLESAVSGHDRLKGNIFVRFLQIFVPLAKRQNISEFWCAEHRVEVIRRMMAGKYASFEQLFASC